jgi:hypothetical protein
MAARKCSGDNEEGLRNLVESVLDSDNECSGFAEDETESEVSFSGSDESSEEIVREVMKKMMTRQTLLNVFELQRRKNRVTGSGPELTTILLSTPLPKTVEFVMTYCQNLKQNHHLNSCFF